MSDLKRECYRSRQNLDREYGTATYWWEIMEMLRRFLLVGLYVCLAEPFHQGGVMQVALANITALLYFTMQLQVMPFKNQIDGYLALGCSLSLSVILLCIIFYKYTVLTELPAIVKRMSVEQRDDSPAWLLPECALLSRVPPRPPPLRSPFLGLIFLLQKTKEEI